MHNTLDLGIDFSQMSEIGVQEKTVSSAVAEMMLEEVSSEDNIGSVIPQIKKNEQEEEFNINTFLDSQIENKVDTTDKKSDILDEDKTKSKDPSSQGTKTSSNVQSLVCKSLREEGALSEFDEIAFQTECDDPEIGVAKALQNVFRKEAELAKAEVLSESEEDFKEYVALLDAGVNRATANSLIQQQATFSRLTLNEIEGESETALAYRKAIIAQNYKNTTSFSDEKITKTIDKLIKNGEDEEEAKEVLPQIQSFAIEQTRITKENAVIADNKRKEDAKSAIKQYKDTINAIDEIVPGQKINKQTKQKIEDYTLNGKIWELRNKDPFKFDAIVSYFALNGAFEGKFTRPATAAKTSAISELQQILNTSTKSGFTPVSNGGDEGEDQDLELVTSMLKKATGKR